MHEFSVCSALLSQVEAIAAEHDAVAVKAISLRIGPLSGVEHHLLDQAFSVARIGTLAENAELVVEALPVRVRCRQCGAESEVSVNRLICGTCGDFRTSLVSGDELLLNSVELDTEMTDAEEPPHNDLTLN